MKLSDDLAYMTATELAWRIRSRQLSPVEVGRAVPRAPGPVCGEGGDGGGDTSREDEQPSDGL